MAGTESKEREAVKNAYPGSKWWPQRVAEMSDAQVIALYIRFKAVGKI